MAGCAGGWGFRRTAMFWPANHCITPCVPVLQGKLSNTEVDQRMVKALSDLPSELGLEAVDKFATSNLDSVRSKTGFMVRPAMEWCHGCPFEYVQSMFRHAYHMQPAPCLLGASDAWSVVQLLEQQTADVRPLRLCRWASSSGWRRRA
jgi:Heterogeneous nuclear ribonucleoprotein Q acidic domain